MVCHVRLRLFRFSFGFFHLYTRVRCTYTRRNFHAASEHFITLHIIRMLTDEALDDHDGYNIIITIVLAFYQKSPNGDFALVAGALHHFVEVVRKIIIMRKYYYYIIRECVSSAVKSNYIIRLQLLLSMVWTFVERGCNNSKLSIALTINDLKFKTKNF